MGTTEDQMNQRIIAIKNETRKRLEKIAKDTISSFKRKKKQNVFEDLEERGKELAYSIEKAVKNIVDHANKVLDDFDKEISNVPNKNIYVDKLKGLLEEECSEVSHLAKDIAIDKFNS